MSQKISHIFNLHPKARTVLDLGCGKGFLSLYAAARGLSVDSIDSNKNLSQFFEGVSNVTFQHKDLSHETLTGSWDIVFLYSVIQFLDKRYVLNTFLPNLLKRNVNVGGIVDLYTFSPEETLETPSKYTLDELLPLFDNFDILKAETVEQVGTQETLGLHTFHKVWITARRK